MGVITLASGPRPPRGSCSEETDSEEKRLAVAEGGQSRCSASKNGGSTRSVTALLAPEVILGLIQTEKMSSQDYYGQQQPHYGGGYPNQPPQAHPPQGGYYPPQQPGYGPPQGYPPQGYQQPPPPQQYQQEQRGGRDHGCLGACLATLCCCFLCEESCECCFDCIECCEGC
ncbi:hypothetical protein EYB26_008736 [Talaromyces marneffei]|nr:uncharacterized protein EYB26_008736 [Talaromyces marneffei]QGA21026.1 hypothetical protein EYB26_008736 [Talaromyces marneffei]